MLRQLRSWAAAFCRLATFAGAVAAGAVAGVPAGAAEGPPVRITHGIVLDPGMVGPSARGLGPLSEHPGGEIRGGRDYPFARTVDAGAVYDGFRIEGRHLLIERVAFTGPVDIYAPLPVVLRGVTIRTRTAAHWALHTRPEAGPVHVLWSWFGAASIEGAPADRSRSLERALYARSDNVTVYRSHLTRAADGIQLHAPGARVVETLIDGLVTWEGDHNDGIQFLGRAADAVILRSRIENPNPQTSCLNLSGGAVRVEATYLSGGGWTLYGGAQTPGRRPGDTRGIVVRDTIFGRDFFPKGGGFGPVTAWDAAPGTGNVWSGNTWSDGKPLEIGGRR